VTPRLARLSGALLSGALLSGALLAGVLLARSALAGPPALPPDGPAGTDAASPDTASPDTRAPTTGEGNSGEQPTVEQPDAPPPPRNALPSGLQQVPFPLEQQQQQRSAPPTGGDESTVRPPAPPPPRRSIVDLRDPFDRPSPRPQTDGGGDRSARLLIPDLKDPFAAGARRVRSKTLEAYVPNDLRDPFRAPNTNARPPCARTTDDGTLVQAPGRQTPQRAGCQPASNDLRDPFTRDR
jgi:hypothetical protein